jgi:hypothetical protein
VSSENNEGSTLDATLRQEALDVLKDARDWDLSTEQWEAVSSILSRLEAALGTADHEQINAAVVDLELASPFRVPPIRRPIPDEHASHQLRERLDRLVHRLDDVEQPEGEDDDEK